MKIRFFSKQGRQETKAEIKDKTRSAEILGVFAKHNFYAGGLTPEELRTTLEDLGPTYIKIGQIASSRTDLLPERYCRELEKLRSNVAPLDFEIVRQVIEQETGKKLEEIYSEFQSKPLGSASIAQAHYGILKDGTRVVTKVQRPQIAEKMRKDFVLLNKLAGIAHADRILDPLYVFLFIITDPTLGAGDCRDYADSFVVSERVRSDIVFLTDFFDGHRRHLLKDHVAVLRILYNLEFAPSQELVADFFDYFRCHKPCAIKVSCEITERSCVLVNSLSMLFPINR